MAPPIPQLPALQATIGALTSRLQQPRNATLPSAVSRRVGIDTRALAALRIAVGSLLIVDLGLRSRYLIAFYTDHGVLPRAVLNDTYPTLGRLSLHALSGALWVQILLFVIAAGFAVALLVGYQTRLVTVLSFVLLVSLHARNPPVLSAGDALLRRLLLWGVFLPLGARWSIDALSKHSSRQRVTSVASAVLLGQVVIVYVVSAVFKLRGDLWGHGHGLPYFFRIDNLTVYLGDVLVHSPGVLSVLDWLWFGMIIASPLLILLTGWPRALFVSLFIAMHTGMLLTMQLGIFPVVSIISLIPFLPTPVWDTVVPRLSNMVDRLTHITSQYLDYASLGLTLSRPGASGSSRISGRDQREHPIPWGANAGLGRAINRVGRWSGPAVVSGLFVSFLVWNAMTLGYVATPDPVRSVVNPADHRWDMFAQGRRADGWFVVSAHLESGQRVDPFQMAPVTFDRPREPADTFPTARWFVYSYEMRKDQALRREFANHLCWRWNTQHDDNILGLTVYYMKQPVWLDGTDPTQRVTVIRHDCS